LSFIERRLYNGVGHKSENEFTRVFYSRENPLRRSPLLFCSSQNHDFDEPVKTSFAGVEIFGHSLIDEFHRLSLLRGLFKVHSFITLHFSMKYQSCVRLLLASITNHPLLSLSNGV
jgi:hypothetical protein